MIANIQVPNFVLSSLIPEQSFALVSINNIPFCFAKFYPIYLFIFESELKSVLFAIRIFRTSGPKFSLIIFQASKFFMQSIDDESIIEQTNISPIIPLQHNYLILLLDDLGVTSISQNWRRIFFSAKVTFFMKKSIPMVYLQIPEKQSQQTRESILVFPTCFAPNIAIFTMQSHFYKGGMFIPNSQLLQK